MILAGFHGNVIRFLAPLCMHTLLKLRNARKVVSQLGAARPGMEVLVLSDLHTHHNVEPLAIAVDEAGASLNLMQIAGSARHGRRCHRWWPRPCRPQTW